jgi:outer membrane protein assembly factor BamE
MSKRLLCFLITISLACAGLLSGCALVPVYKPNIQQGNVFSAEEVAQVKPGMTPTQVQYLLGTPVLVTTFSPNRWEYVYSFQSGGKLRTLKRATITFVGERVVNVRT